MSIDEAFAVANVGPPDCGGGSLEYMDYLWFDKGRGEVLCLCFEIRGNPLTGNLIDRLTKWSVEKLPYQSTRTVIQTRTVPSLE
jgi:hypothetical protein